MADSTEGKDLAFSQSYQIFLKEISNQAITKTKPVSALSSGLDLSDVLHAASATVSAMDKSSKAEQLAASAVMPSSTNSVDEKVDALSSISITILQ